MENTTQKSGFWMLVEEIGQPQQEEPRRADKREILDDEFFPDTSF